MTDAEDEDFKVERAHARAKKNLGAAELDFQAIHRAMNAVERDEDDLAEIKTRCAFPQKT